MKIIRIISLVMTVICILGVFSGCYKTEVNRTENENKMDDRSYTIENAAEYLKIYGRTVSRDGGEVAFDHTASGIEFNVKIKGKLKMTVEVSKETYFTVYIDGVRSDKRLMAKEGSNLLELANFSEEGTHNVKILKQTESLNSLCVFKGILFHGYFEETPESGSMNIEFIGDSITAGYGNLGEAGVENPGSALYQDGTKTFAYMAAELLDADHSMVCCSGIGVTKGYRDYVESQYFVKQSYDRSAAEYTFTQVPDLVVINLGTNDMNTGADETQFLKDTKALIELIRSVYGTNVPIIWAHGMMNDGYIDIIHQVLDALGGEGAGLYTCELVYNKNGANGHPDLTGHEESAKKLAEFIERKGL